MRTEQEMYDRILGFARADKRVRAVYLNGSRANPHAPGDRYRDFDIVFVVTDFESFRSDPDWINVFGERLILKMPEAMRAPSGRGHFNWMMLFTDGNRLDLTLIPSTKSELIENDSETVVLLDKDEILPEFPPASDRDYLVRRPDALFYHSCCNNFFWCMQNVAKGIVRDELPYAMGMYHFILDDELNDMAAWYIGTKNDFGVSVGKMGKYFKKYLPADLYQQYLTTCATTDEESFWNAIFAACALFRTLAKQVAAALGFTYNQQDDDGIMTYLHAMKSRAL